MCGYLSVSLKLAKAKKRKKRIVGEDKGKGGKYGQGNREGRVKNEKKEKEKKRKKGEEYDSREEETYFSQCPVLPVRINLPN